MSYLLDTHTLLSFINGDTSLPRKVINEIINLKNQCFISIASIWEIAIKIKLSKLTLVSDFNRLIEFFTENQIEILPLTFSHIQSLNELEPHHRDPFDRILIAQAITEDLTILSKDKIFTHYNINLLW